MKITSNIYKFKSKQILFLILLVILCKIILLFFISTFDGKIFGGGNDANYYNAYALGYADIAKNFWSVILRWLNEFGLYSRQYIALFLSFLATFVIPYMVAELALVRGWFPSKIEHKIFLVAFLLISIYPSVFYMSLDIYRDDVMLVLCLVGFFLFHALSQHSGLLRLLFFFSLALALSWVLYLFRPYLGFGYLVALLCAPLYSFKRYSLLWTVLIFLLLLWMANLVGALDSILDYRALFSNGMLVGGSNLGIEFSSHVTFLFNFLLSAVYEMFGFYFGSVPSILAFISESTFFLVAFIYLVKNRRYSNKFVDYLVVFFVVYGVIWVLGNGNMGAAARLRMFNYIAVYIACFIVYQNKRISLTNKA